MREDFTLPALSQNARLTLSKEVINTLRQHVGLASVSDDALGLLSGIFKVFEAYQHLSLGMNPKIVRHYREQLALADDIHAVRDLVRSMRQHKARYVWDRTLSTLLSQNRFWEANTISDTARLRAMWGQLKPYAYYRSDDLLFLSQFVFPRLERYINSATRELSQVNPRKRAHSVHEINQLDLFLASMRQSATLERQRMARAMLVRLQLAAQHQRLDFDDVMHHFSEQLKASGFQPETVSSLGVRPYNTPSVGLSRDSFHHFHAFIQSHGDEDSVAALQKLSWVKQGHYVYDASKRRWKTHSNLFKNARISASKWRPRWLFRGRNARHEAFHDVTKYVGLSLLKQSLETLQSQIGTEGRAIGGLDDSVLDRLTQGFQLVREEHERITGLRKGLTRFIHSKSRRVLKAYLGELTSVAEAIIQSQLTILQGAHDSLVSIIHDDEKLDKVLHLIDRVSEAVNLLPPDHVLVGRASTLQTNLRSDIARQKLDAFSLAIQDLPFRKRAIYNAKGIVYEVADHEEVHAYFTRATKYLAPQQAKALWFIAGLLIGDHYREGGQITYDDIYSAMSHCFDDPAPIVQMVVEKIVAPSIFATHSIGYRLLMDCEGRIGQGRRSDILNTLERRQKEALFSALRHVLEAGVNLNEQTTVTVDAREMTVNEFVARVSVLEKPALDVLAKNYLDNFQGDHEALWRIFEMMPTVHAAAYAHQRLSYLLKQSDYLSIANSDCLSVLQHILKEDDVRTNAMLARFVGTIIFGIDDIPTINAVIQRFANSSVQAIWESRCENFLRQRFNKLLYQEEGENIASLSAFLRQNSTFLQSETAKANLAEQLRYVPHDAWTAQHHALVDAIGDVDLRHIYYSRLLERILTDRHFAGEHEQSIPMPEDILGCFEVMTAPEFKAVCQKALQHFSQQDRIENVAGFRVLANLLMHDLTVTLDLDDLKTEMEQLLLKFKAQLDVTMTAKEIMSFIDGRHFENAKEKLRWMKYTLSYYQSIDDQKSCDEITRAVTIVVEAIQDRAYRHPTATGALNPNTALELVDVMPTINFVEQLQWKLKNYWDLSGIAIRLQSEIWDIDNGKTSVLSSLPLFLEASRRGELVLSETHRKDLITVLRIIIERETFATLPEQSRLILTALFRLLTDQSREEDGPILSEHQRRLIEQARVQTAEPEKTMPDLRSGKAAPAVLTLTVDVQNEMSQQIIDNLQSSEFCEVAIQKLKQVFSLKHGDEALRKTVALDLLMYFRMLYFKTVESGGQEKYALSQLKQLCWVINKVEQLPNYNFIILARRWDRIESTINQMAISLRDFGSKTNNEIPELNEFLLVILEEDILDAPTREEWAAFLEQILLPGIQESELEASPQLSAALSALFRLLKNSYSDEDRQNISSYGKHYSDVVVGSVHDTQSIRIISPLGESGRPKANVVDLYNLTTEARI